MIHPILRNRTITTLYFTLWIIIIIFHSAFVFFIHEIPYSFALTESVITNLLFCALGLILWFVLKYSESQNATFFNVFINQLTAASLLLVIWNAFLIYINKYIFNNSEVYRQFIETSLPFRILTSIFYYIIIMLIYYLLNFYNDLKEKYSNEIKLKEMVKDAELNMLKSQINPHFLFNSLNSISSLTLIESQKAHEMIIKLSDFLRYSVTQAENDFSTLKHELDNAQRYLDIEKIRFGNKLIYSINTNNINLNIPVPVMILQPLYENAVKHGVYESTEPIAIKTQCYEKETFLEITIENNFEDGIGTKKGAGLGLTNISERLRLIYGQGIYIKIEKNENRFLVKLTLPK